MDVDPSQPPASSGLEDALSRTSRLAVAGFILAVAMPIAGLVIGVILVNRADRRTVKQGIWMIGLSVVATFVFFVVLIISMHSTGGEGTS